MSPVTLSADCGGIRIIVFAHPSNAHIVRTVFSKIRQSPSGQIDVGTPFCVPLTGVRQHRDVKNVLRKICCGDNAMKLECRYLNDRVAEQSSIDQSTCIDE